MPVKHWHFSSFKEKDKTCSNSIISSDSTIIIITTHATDIAITTGTTNTWDPLPQERIYNLNILGELQY